MGRRLDGNLDFKKTRRQVKCLIRKVKKIGRVRCKSNNQKIPILKNNLKLEYHRSMNSNSRFLLFYIIIFFESHYLRYCEKFQNKCASANLFLVEELKSVYKYQYWYALSMRRIKTSIKKFISGHEMRNIHF